MQKLFLFIFTLAISFLLYLQSCTYSKEPAPPWSCDSRTPPTYNKDIKAFMDDNCINCHSAGGIFSSLPLRTYEDVKKYTQTGKVLESMKQDGTVPPMPFGQMKLPQLVLDKMECWKNNGCPE